MSKLTRLFRRFTKDKQEDTESEILRHNSRRAKDKTGQTCTLPMSPDKAGRISRRLHYIQKFR